MLRKTYPSRYHDERPYSCFELDPEEAPPKATPTKPGNVHVELVGPDHPQHPNNLARQTPSSDEPESSEDSGPSEFAIQSHWPQEHHRRLCTICRHPMRGGIEEEFLHWASPDAIAHHYSVGWRSVYRHAHATGLFEKRGRNLRSALGHIIEHANHVVPTARDVIRSVRSYACLNENGKWTEPATRVVVSSGTKSRANRRIARAAIQSGSSSRKRASRAERPLLSGELPDNGDE